MYTKYNLLRRSQLRQNVHPCDNANASPMIRSGWYL